MSDLYGLMTSLSSKAETRLSALFARLQAGDVTAAEFRAAAIAIVVKANALAYGLADASLAAFLETSTGTPTPTLGLSVPAGDAERLGKGLETLLVALANGEDIAERVARYGRSEPLSAFQDAYSDGMQQHGLTGYVRVLSPGACQLCQWLYRDGHVWPTDKPFHRHDGCACHPQPVSPEGQA